MLQVPSSIALAALLVLLAGCAAPDGGHGPGIAGHRAMIDGRMAVASLTPTVGNEVRGLIVFHQVDGGLMVHVRISGLKPNGEHGFHVHETGSCASVDGNSAGGHFNPDSQPHGPQNAARHAGDLPSIKADEAGQADFKFKVAGATVAAGRTSVVGRSVIVHAQADDYQTQPTGNSGARIGCGVIATH